MSHIPRLIVAVIVVLSVHFAPVTTQAKSSWVVTERASPEGPGQDVYASLAAVNDEGVWSEEDRPVLMVHCQTDRSAIQVYVLANIDTARGKPVADARFHAPALMHASLEWSDALDAFLFPSTSEAIGALRNHGRMALQFGTITMEPTGALFVLEGAGEALQPVIDACPTGGEVPDASADEQSPPKVTGPLIPGIGRVTDPVLTSESQRKPEYPKKARKERVSGNVILQAIIRADGSVTDLEVLKVDPPGYGFEKAAIDAARQWRYRPSTLDGDPVDVYLTINVTFKLD